MTTSRLTKLLYGHDQPCYTKNCKGMARADSYGQVESGLCLDCEVDAAYDSETFGYVEDNLDKSFVVSIAPRSQRRPVVSDEYLQSESTKNHRFTRRYQTKKANLRKLTILERQLGDHEYFKRDNYGYQESHETWRERSRHLVRRNRSIRQVLMRTYADAATRHGWACGRYGDHECQAPGVIYSGERLGGNWQRKAERSKWYRDPAPRKTTTDLAIRGAVSDYLDLSWAQPALRTRKDDPRLSRQELEANDQEHLPPTPQIGQFYSFAEWFDAYTALSKRERKLHRLERRHRMCQGFTVNYRQHHCGPANAYTTASNPDYFLPVQSPFYWPLKQWLGRYDWRYSRLIRVNGATVWNGPRLTYVNTAPKKPYKDATATKKGSANWGHIRLA